MPDRREAILIASTNASRPSKKRILTVCVKLFLEQGYKKTTVAQIVQQASVSNSIFQNIFRAKDGVLTELAQSMFSNQFAMARSTAGTQLLPYAQMDRFMARLSVGYPDHDAQMALLKDRLSENPLDAVSQVLTREELLAMQAEARAVQTSDALLDYITRLTMASRDHAEIEVGVSPRGALLLCQMAKARAYLLGRDFAVSEDVQAVFEPVCAHRLIPTAKARLSGVCATDIARSLLQSVPNPDYMA